VRPGATQAVNRVQRDVAGQQQPDAPCRSFPVGFFNPGTFVPNNPHPSAGRVWARGLLSIPSFLGGTNMKFRYSPVALAVFAALGSVTAAPQVAQAQQSLERVTITGSNIRRTDQETVAPVEIITREQIERTGLATISDVIKTIPSNLGGSYSESFANSFASGASGLSLRGLGQKTTLVLLNGRRTAGYGFAQNLQDSFVDFNSIPTSAIERVEILKDGASAIYGSDAIAGVINIILRKDYKGIEAGASVGFFEGANDYRANLVGGFGDLGKDKFNVFGVFDYYKRDHLLLSDTKFGETRDYRDEQGGRNHVSLTAGGTWTQVGTNNRRAISECGQYGGRVLDYNGAVNAGLINLGVTNGVPNAPAAPGVGLNQPGNTWCSFDQNSQLSALPEQERFGFLGRGTFDFAANIQGFAEVGYSKVDNFQTFTAPFFAGTTGLTQTAAGLQPFTYNITFGPGVAGNPFGANATIAQNMTFLGTRDQETSSETWRFLGGLRYSFGGWDLESAVGWSKNEVDQNNINRLAKDATSALFGVPNNPTAGPPPAFPPNPVSTGSACNLDAPSTTLAACRTMLVNVGRIGESELRFVDTKATTELGSLPGGAIGLATGFEFRKEELTDTPDAIAQAGGILGQGITATNGERDQWAVYGELALPITRQLEAQLALRYDDYSDFGTAVTPKAGLKFKATPELLLRANWGRGFRAPSLPEISPSVATFFTQVNDDFTGQAGVQISGVFAGNPFLQPEKSRATTLGFVWEPNSSFNVAVDWYEITWSNIVAAPLFQSIVDIDVDSRNAGGPGDPRVIRDPVTGVIVTVLSNYQNLTRVETSGVDIDARYIARTNWGRFTTRLNTTYVDSFEEEGTECVGTNGCTNTYPRWKGYVSLDWDQGPWAVTGRVNYIHHYYQNLLAGSFFTPQHPLFQNGTYPIRVPSYTTFDLFARYNINPNLYVFGSIVNVTDEVPPYDPGFSATFNYDFTQYDVRGRQYRIGLNYRFR
jgi:iron complex outermembrane receptor protein